MRTARWLRKADRYSVSFPFSRMGNQPRIIVGQTRKQILHSHNFTIDNYCHFTTRVLSGFHNSPDRVSDDICPDKIAIICHHKQEKYNQKTIPISQNHALHSPCGSFRLETGRHDPQHRVSAGSTMRLSSAAPQSTFSKATFCASTTFRTGEHGLSTRFADFADTGKDTVPGGSAFHSSSVLWPHAALDYEAGTVSHKSLSPTPFWAQEKSGARPCAREHYRGTPLRLRPFVTTTRRAHPCPNQ